MKKLTAAAVAVTLLLFILVGCASAGGGANNSDGPNLLPSEGNLPNGGGNAENGGDTAEDGDNLSPDGENGGEDETPPPADVPPTLPPVRETVTMLRATSLGVNVRSAASDAADSLGTLDKDDLLIYKGVRDGWYITLFKKRTAYVRAAYAVLMTFDKADARVEAVVEQGCALMGYPYVWGAQRYLWSNGTLNGNFVVGRFDCSSLMQYIFYKGAGVPLNVNTRTQVLQGRGVERTDLQRGDVMFFTNDNRVNNTGVERVGHVGLYLGDNYILHTASDYAVIEPISSKRWEYLLSIKRFI